MLTEDEKMRARHHLGYLGVQESSTFNLGIPAGVQTQFMIEGAFNKLMPQAEPKFRQLLDRLDLLEQQIEDNSENLAASKVDEIELRPDEFQRILDRYHYWRNAIANLLGIVANPFDARFSSPNGGINVPVG